MRPTFRETADKQLSGLKFTENMRLGVIVRGRRRVHYTRRIAAAAAVFLAMLTGISAFFALRPDGAPDNVAAPGSTYEYMQPQIFSSENFDIYVTEFDHSGMYIDISYSLVSRAESDVIVIRSPFYDDEPRPQNEVTVTETLCEPEFPTFAEQAILLPAGGQTDFDMHLSLSEWKRGEEAVPCVRFDFLKPAVGFTPAEYLTLAETPLLIELDDIHIDIARAATEKTDNPSTVMVENAQISVRDWPSDTWAYYKTCDYRDVPRWLAADGFVEDEGENIVVSFTLSNQPETLTVMCAGTVYSEAAADAFSAENPEIQLLRTDPDAHEKADILIIDSTSPEISDILANGAFLPYIGQSNELSDIYSRLYPAVQESLSVKNVPAALPVAMTFETYLSWYPSGFAQLGLTEDDVPKTWLELLIFLQKLPEINSGSPMVTAFEWPMSVDEVKRAIFDGVVYASAIEMSRDGESFDPDHHYIKRLMLEYDKIDFEALCLPAGSAADGGFSHLFGLHGVVDPSHAEYSRTNQRPMPLALFNKFEPVVNANLVCAFISADCCSYPYAIEYIELLTEYRRDGYDEIFFRDYAPFSAEVTEESLAWYAEHMEHLELTPATLDDATGRYLYDMYFYGDD